MPGGGLERCTQGEGGRRTPGNITAMEVCSLCHLGLPQSSPMLIPVDGAVQSPVSNISPLRLELFLWWDMSPGAPVATPYGSPESRCHTLQPCKVGPELHQLRLNLVSLLHWAALLLQHYCFRPTLGYWVRLWLLVSELSWSCSESCYGPQTHRACVLWEIWTCLNLKYQCQWGAQHHHSANQNCNEI